MTYTFFYSEKKILNEIITTQYNKTDYISHLIDNHLKLLVKDVRFLSNLDVMNDILSEDIDRRISNILIQKTKDYNLDMDLIVIDRHYIILSSSNNALLLKKFPKQYTFTSKNGYFIDASKLYIYSKIFASFDLQQEIGTLIMSYDLQNLNQYLINQKEYHSYLVNHEHSYFIGKDVGITIDNFKQKNSIITDKNVIVYKQLNGVLKGWYIVYGVNKEIALSFLFELTNLIAFLLPLSLLFIIFIALKYSKRIVQPVEKLTFVTDEIIKTKDYATTVNIEGEDEIAKLGNSFNKMIETTNNALKQLEYENSLRLTRFIQLIEIFNTIIQTNNEEECLKISTDYLKTLTKIEHIYFVKHARKNPDYTHLYVNDFEKSKKIYFGSLTLNIQGFQDKNEQRFYSSIITMIILQLDRVRLINKTISVSNAKSAFISLMSHELRTPLSAIIGYTEYMISYEELNDDQMDIISNIESSAHYLLSMINEILDITKIEAGKMEAYIQDVDVLKLTKSVYDMLLPLAQSKELQLDFEYEESKNNIYKTDAKMFKQIVVNLVSNAIKFTCEGSIKIKLLQQSDRVILSIKDTGIGISKDDIKNLFNDFTQIKNNLQEKHKGTGLGLSLSKKMAQILEGDVYLKSEGMGKGSTAYFYIMIK
ncbi:HAMP domain-containing protein [bacterium]|nr:HAMP domain-containing protein [bacterium]MBU1884541.1 HAMP domain-containing protein [bacterium]